MYVLDLVQEIMKREIKVQWNKRRKEMKRMIEVNIETKTTKKKIRAARMIE